MSRFSYVIGIVFLSVLILAFFWGQAHYREREEGYGSEDGNKRERKEGEVYREGETEEEVEAEEDEQLSEERSPLITDWVHIAYTSNNNETTGGGIEQLLSSIRSWLLFRDFPLHVHIVFPGISWQEINSTIHSWNINPENFKISFYDYTLECPTRIRKIKNYLSKDHSTFAPICKIYLHLILPNTVTNVIALDPSVWVAQAGVYKACWRKVWDEMIQTTSYIGMAEDPYAQPTKFPWPPLEGVDYNAGVLWLSLERMRINRWTERILAESKALHGKSGGIRVRNGEHGLLNNLRMREPDFLLPVPCGCNWQIYNMEEEFFKPPSVKLTKCELSSPVFIVHHAGKNTTIAALERFELLLPSAVVNSSNLLGNETEIENNGNGNLPIVSLPLPTTSLSGNEVTTQQEIQKEAEAGKAGKEEGEEEEEGEEGQVEQEQAEGDKAVKEGQEQEQEEQEEKEEEEEIVTLSRSKGKSRMQEPSPLSQSRSRRSRSRSFSKPPPTPSSSRSHLAKRKQGRELLQAEDDEEIGGKEDDYEEEEAEADRLRQRLQKQKEEEEEEEEELEGMEGMRNDEGSGSDPYANSSGTEEEEGEEEENGMGIGSGIEDEATYFNVTSGSNSTQQIRIPKPIFDPSIPSFSARNIVPFRLSPFSFLQEYLYSFTFDPRALRRLNPYNCYPVQNPITMVIDDC